MGISPERSEIQRIRQRMDSCGLTEARLSAASGISSGALRSRLRGTTPLTVAELRAIAAVLGVSAHELLINDGTENPTEKNER